MCKILIQDYHLCRVMVNNSFSTCKPLSASLKLLETSTILSLWVVCHGHRDFGRYHPLVGYPEHDWSCFWKSFWLVPHLGCMVHPYIAYTLWGCAAGQDMVYYLSVAKGIWFRESLSTGYFLQDWFDLLDEFCLFSKYTKVMTIMYHALLQLPINGFKTRLRSFCPLS